MRSLREIVAVFLFTMSIIAVPPGIIFLAAHICHRLEESFGLCQFGASMILPVALLWWIRIWRGKWNFLRAAE